MSRGGCCYGGFDCLARDEERWGYGLRYVVCSFTMQYTCLCKQASQALGVDTSLIASLPPLSSPPLPTSCESNPNLERPGAASTNIHTQTNKKQPAALYFLSRRYVTEPKITANRRVVVIGASSTALACLEGLAFTPYLNLTSLTLVSPNGIPAAADVASTTTEAAGNRAVGDRSGPGGAVEEAKGAFPEGGKYFDGVNGGEDRGRKRGGAGSSLSPLDEDAPDADRMARMGLERHVRVVR